LFYTLSGTEARAAPYLTGTGGSFSEKSHLAI